MNEIRKIIVILFGLLISVATSLLVMTHGWGLEVKSWWWIIGGSLGGHMLGQLFVMLGSGKDK